MQLTVDFLLFLFWLGAIIAFMVWQAARFLDCHGGPPLSRRQIFPVIAAFSMACVTLFLAGPGVPALLRGVTLFALFLPMALLDLRCYWLPQRFTVTFWLLGGVSACLPGAPMTLLSSLLFSAAVFTVLYSLRTVALRYRGEVLGLGDVYLMAGMFAWLPWRAASYAGAGALLLCALASLLIGRRSQPLAPALLTVLTAAVLFFPRFTQGVL
ncbi:prepilin peptidase [Rahnella sp. BCC 1045]|uniref:prepilin peptidase n=1 Tax=Rahnella sp. BCC 1045 TaxID=2816251 RepID=UPI001C26D83E|nr:prepilin peptidase [Rahnella sp. BCC 1045]MBU9819676.1 prepilin peptidase [Rahnella sp. BCC 1045]